MLLRMDTPTPPPDSRIARQVKTGLLGRVSLAAFQPDPDSVKRHFAKIKDDTRGPVSPLARQPRSR